jgi:hypothetical protein
MRIRPCLPVLLLSPFLLVGLYCVPIPDSDGDTAVGDTGHDEGTTSTHDDTGGSEVAGFDGYINGTVRVGLYDYNENCELVMREWDADDAWPFGGIWVYAFSEDGSGDETYHDTETFLTPDVLGNDYSLRVLTTETESVLVGATLDFNGDRILGTSEPVGLYPDKISASGGQTVVGVDITILAYWNPVSGDDCSPDGSGGSGSGGGGGSGGSGSGGGDGSGGSSSDDGGGSTGDGSGSDGSGSDGSGSGEGGVGEGGDGVGSDGDDGTTTIAGDILITEAYAAGEAAAMLMTTANEGPLISTIVQPVADGGGAVAAYELTTTYAYGVSNLMGCWDSNFNMLFDGEDQCGGIISEPGVDANPIDVAPPEDLVPADIEIPLGEYQLDLVPFVVVSGNLLTDQGTFDVYPSGTEIWIAAIKFLPDEEFTSTDLLDASYDVVHYEPAELTGQSALPFALAVPSNTVIYLLAFGDTDGDGTLNEPDDPIASGSSHDSGRLATGSSNQSVDMEMHPYNE